MLGKRAMGELITHSKFYPFCREVTSSFAQLHSRERALFEGSYKKSVFER